MIIDLELKLSGELPVNRLELIELVNSWGRFKKIVINDDDYIEMTKKNECYNLSNLDA